jgi:phosphoribosylglycinamide formyltransferase-1
MISPVDRIRQVALALPETEQRPFEGEPAFFVAGTRFAALRGDTLELMASGEASPSSIALGGDIDWAQVEDALAQAWELAAPQHLLEAGGR